MLQDLRDWLQEVDAAGELLTVHGAHWQHEIGTLCEMVGSEAQALLFDDITDFPSGYRVLTNAVNSLGRLSLSLGLPRPAGKLAALQAIRAKMAGLRRIPPRLVDSGPVLDVVKTGAEVNLYDFPAPWFHEGDGGRYIGTGSVCITRDPESGWVNFGAYRCQVHSRNSTGVGIALGHHGNMVMEKYWQQGSPAPMAISLGHDPLLFVISGTEVPYGISEYDVAGGYRGAPVDVVAGPHTGLPIPAGAELVLEGEVYGDERHPEGPFAEWAGYYVSRERPRLVFHVKSICHRRAPIILAAQPGKPPSDNTFFLSPFKSAAIWNELETAGVPGVRGVWSHELGGGRMFVAVAITQMYPGHSKQAGHIAAYCNNGAYASRLIVVVDADIDPTDLNDVMWAVCTRADFQSGIDLSHRNWTSPNDPSKYPAGETTHVFNSKMIIDACRPWERRETFPPVAVNSPELWRQVGEKFQDILAQRRHFV